MSANEDWIAAAAASTVRTDGRWTSIKVPVEITNVDVAAIEELAAQERLEFAAARGAVLDATDNELRPVVEDSLENYVLGEHDWYDGIVDGAAVLWHETFEAEHGRAPTATELAQFQSQMAGALEKTNTPDDPPSDTQVDTITRWASTYAVNAATAAGDGALEWVTRHDGDVRTTHKPLEGRLRGEDGTWSVGGYDLHFPGEPVGPPAVWINCRCLARRVQEGNMDTVTAAAPVATEDQVDDVDEVAEDDEEAPDWSDDMDTDVEWHGVLAPIGKMSGDRRKFTQMLRNRDLPLPLTWQKAEDDAHNGAVVVGNIEQLALNEDTNEVEASGRFHTSPESDEVIGLIANGMLSGVSVALDDATVEYQNEDGTTYDLDNPSETPPVTAVTDGRIASATVVPIPAFQEGYIALGPWEREAEPTEAEQLAAAGCAPCEAMAEAEEWMSEEHFAVSEAAWDGSASRFDDDQWKNSCILDRGTGDTAKTRYALPIKEPGGSLSRAGVHAAAGRLDQVDAPDAAKAAARRKLLAAYRQLEEDPPESIAASAFVDLVHRAARAAFVVPRRAGLTPAQVRKESGWKVTFAPGTHDGPGWVTHPRDSQRLRDYWTRGKGAAKIRWGEPGDFNRCRKHLAKYVPNPEYLAGTCANLHKVAIALWPGQESGKKHAVEGLTAAAAYEFAVEEYPTPPAEWFADPELDGPTPLTVDDTGRVYGHLATFGTCHIGLGLSVGQDGCTDVPRSATDYAYFNVGAVVCDDGFSVSVGHITLGTGHAPGRLKAIPAAAHYDNTGSVVADVHAGEDQYGVWVAGWVRPGITAEQLANLRAASLSGDWRKVRGSYELVAALAVNVPGFPIPRLQVAASATEAYSLTAAGIVQPEDEDDERLDVAAIIAGFKKLTEAFQEMRTRLVAGLTGTTLNVEPTPTLRNVEVARAKIRAVRASQAREKIRG